VVRQQLVDGELELGEPGSRPFRDDCAEDDADADAKPVG
jgi:hypothetical protein